MKTTTVRLIEAAFETAVSSRLVEPVAIIGDAGVGKTTALTHIAGKRTKVAFVTVTPTNRRLKAMLAMAVAAFRIPTDAFYAADLASALEYNLEYLVADGWCLVVDEVQLLDAEAVFQLCKYTELFRLPLILAGNSHSLKRTRATASAIEQVRSRIGRWVIIDGVSADDIREFAIDANVEGREAHELLVRYGRQASLRELARLLDEARTFAGEGGSIRLAALHEALASIHGPKRTNEILNPKGD
ncbi:MAG: AAA family ATPase [Bauldia sp.]